MQSHYGPRYGEKARETSRLEFHYSERPVSNLRFRVLNDQEIFYPRDSVLARTMTHVLDDSVSLAGLIPHAHYLTKKFDIYAITKEGRHIPLLYIPFWDYPLQGNFLFQRSVNIPAEATIYCHVVIDNTNYNPTQPNRPPRDVKFDISSKGEMLTLVLIEKDFRQEDGNRKNVILLN